MARSPHRQSRAEAELDVVFKDFNFMLVACELGGVWPIGHGSDRAAAGAGHHVGARRAARQQHCTPTLHGKLLSRLSPFFLFVRVFALMELFDGCRMRFSISLKHRSIVQVTSRNGTP